MRLTAWIHYHFYPDDPLHWISREKIKYIVRSQIKWTNVFEIYEEKKTNRFDALHLPSATSSATLFIEIGLTTVGNGAGRADAHPIRRLGTET